MKVICIYNDPSNPPEGCPDDFNYGLILGKEYLVMGMMKNGDQIYYFIDEKGKPDLYPIELFEIKESKLCPEWYFKAYNKSDEMYPYAQALWGYNEFCFDENHYEQIIDREREALELYFKRKIEYEKNLEDLEYLK